jgi:hypothetical protein
MKVAQFEWTQDCASSFQRLKSLLTRVPIFRIVDLDEYFVVCMDA